MPFFSKIKKTVTQAITTSAAAYAALDQVGDVLEVQAGGDAVTLDNLVCIDENDIGPELLVHFFSADPENTSADNEALVVPDANMSTYLGSALVGNTYDLDANTSKACSETGIGLQMEIVGGKVYALVQSVGTPTIGATSGVSLKFGFILDHKG